MLNEIMTSVEDLVSDPSQHVRAALGTQISGLAPILGKEESVPPIRRRCLTSLLTSHVQDYCAPPPDVFADAQGRVPRCPPSYHLQAGIG